MCDAIRFRYVRAGNAPRCKIQFQIVIFTSHVEIACAPRVPLESGNGISRTKTGISQSPVVPLGSRPSPKDPSNTSENRGTSVHSLTRGFPSDKDCTPPHARGHAEDAGLRPDFTATCRSSLKDSAAIRTRISAAVFERRLQRAINNIFRGRHFEKELLSRAGGAPRRGISVPSVESEITQDSVAPPLLGRVLPRETDALPIGFNRLVSSV